MNDLKADYPKRRAIEGRILSAADRITIESKEACFDDEVVQDFTGGWRELIEYYRVHDDDQIGVEVIRE